MRDLLPPERAHGVMPGSGGEMAGGLEDGQSLVVVSPVDATDAAGAEPPSLLEYWRLLWQHRLALLLFMGLGFFGGIAAIVREQPVYSSRAVIEVQTSPDDPAAIAAGRPKTNPAVTPEFLGTQTRILLSRGLRREAARKLLAGNKKYAAPPDSLSQWRVVRWLRGPNFTGPVPRVDLFVKPIEKSVLIEILTESVDPVAAADYANLVVDSYREASASARWNSTQQQSAWLRRQLEDLRNKLQKAEGDLQSYRVAAGLLAPGTDVRVDQLKQIQDELTRAQAERMARQSAYEVAVLSPIETLPQVIDNERLNAHQAKLADLRRELAELSAEFTPEHYRVRRVQAQLAETEATIKRERESVLARVSNDYRAAERREKLLAQAFQTQAALVAEKNSKVFYSEILAQEVDSLRALYDDLLRKLREISTSASLTLNTTRVVDAAEPAREPVRPEPLRYLAIGLVAGMALGVLYVFTADYVNRSLKAPGETPFHLRVPELGVIPAYETMLEPAKARQGAVPSLNGAGALNGQHTPNGKVELITWQNRPSIIAESFRGTLASILVGGKNKVRPRVLLLTSPRRADGKSTTVSNLGIAMAEINQKVLLIDADMRKPSLHQIFDVPNNWGLSDLLRERAPLANLPVTEQLAKKTKIDGLYLLPSGPGTASIANLLYSTRLLELVQRLRDEFDMILIDTPPMMYLSDARVLGRLADGAILVLRACKSTKDEAMRCKQRLTEDGIEVMGTILNGWDLKAKGRESDYSYYYYGDDGERSQN
jgi:capsular exopolysaccharide synthesis family protein